VISQDARENVVAHRLTEFTPCVPTGSPNERCTACGRRVYASEVALSLHGALFHSRCALYESRAAGR